MKALFTLVAVTTLAGSLAWADTSNSHEQKNTQQYGNCLVSTGVDMFTDEETYDVSCFGGETSPYLHIYFQSEHGLSLVINAGVQAHFEATIPVLIRVDKGELIRRSAHWLPESIKGNAHIFDDQALIRHLLHDLARGQKVHIQVGTERGSIPLNGANRAIQDFRRRAGLIYQQSLEISPPLTPKQEVDRTVKCLMSCDEQGRDHISAAQCMENPLICN